MQSNITWRQLAGGLAVALFVFVLLAYFRPDLVEDALDAFGVGIGIVLRAFGISPAA